MLGQGGICEEDTPLNKNMRAFLWSLSRRSQPSSPPHTYMPLCWTTRTSFLSFSDQGQPTRHAILPASEEHVCVFLRFLSMGGGSSRHHSSRGSVVTIRLRIQQGGGSPILTPTHAS